MFPPNQVAFVVVVSCNMLSLTYYLFSLFVVDIPPRFVSVFDNFAIKIKLLSNDWELSPIVKVTFLFFFRRIVHIMLFSVYGKKVQFQVLLRVCHFSNICSRPTDLQQFGCILTRQGSSAFKTTN